VITLPDGLIAFKTGDLLSPSDLSKSYQYINDVIKDIGGQRYTHTPVLYRLAAEGSPLTNTDYATDQERCVIRFTRPPAAEVEVERIFCSAIYTASQPVDAFVLDSNNNPIIGVRQPIFTLPALAALETEPEEQMMTNSFMMATADSPYKIKFIARSSGTFSFNKLDVTIIFKTDCFNFANFNTLDGSDLVFTEADPPDADRQLALQTTITNAAAAIAAARRPYRPALIQVNNFTTGTSANLRRIELPLAPTTANCTLAIQYAYAIYTTSGTRTCTAVIANSAGATQYTTNISVSSSTFGSTSTTIGQDLTDAVGAYDPATDWRMTLSTSADTVYRAYILMWYY